MNSQPLHCTRDQVFLVYKFMDTPIDTIIQGIQSKQAVVAKKYYKQIVKHIHPDKNGHPLAKEAF